MTIQKQKGSVIIIAIAVGAVLIASSLGLIGAFKLKTPVFQDPAITQNVEGTTVNVEAPKFPEPVVMPQMESKFFDDSELNALVETLQERFERFGGLVRIIPQTYEGELTMNATTSLSTTTISQFEANEISVQLLRAIGTTTLATTTITHLQVSGEVTLSSPVTFSTTSTLATTTVTQLQVSGESILTSNLIVNGGTTLGDAATDGLTVIASTTFQDNVLFNGTTTHSATTTMATTTMTHMQISGESILSSTLIVSGTSTFATATIKHLQVSGAITFSSAVDMSNTLTVVGTSTLATSTATQLQVSGEATLNSNVYLASLTEGSVLFLGSNGLISQDNTNLFWNDTNNFLGVGTTSPNALLAIYATTTTGGELFRVGTTTQDYFLIDGNGGLIADFGTSTLATTTITQLQVSGETTLNSNTYLNNLVGLGTTSPNALLSIYATTTTGGELFRISTTTQDYFLIDGNGGLTADFGSSTLATTSITQLEVSQVSVDMLTGIGTSSLATTTVTQFQVSNEATFGSNLWVNGGINLGDALADDLTVNASTTFQEPVRFNGTTTFSTSTTFVGEATFQMLITADGFSPTVYATTTATTSLTKANMQSASFFPVDIGTDTVTITLNASLDTKDIGRRLVFMVASGTAGALKVIGNGSTMTVTGFDALNSVANVVGDHIECIVLSEKRAVCRTYASD